MPDDVAPVGDAPPAVATPSEPAPRQVGFNASAFDSFFEETAKEMGLDPETLDALPEEPSPAEDDTPAGDTEEGDKPADTEEDDKPADEDDKPADAEEDDKPADGDAPVIPAKDGAEVPLDGESQEKTVAESVLELLRDPATLEAAIRQNGVENITELPLVKELLGRERQSTEDKVKAELAKQAWTRQAVTQVQEQGQKAAEELFAAIENLQKEIADDVDGTAELHIPSKELMAEKMKQYADGQVNAYHNSTWGDLSDLIYSLPELRQATPEQRAELATLAGADARTWLQKHLETSRQNLWTLAQATLVEQTKAAMADERKTLEAAHKVEVEKLVAKQEKAMAKAVEEARKEAHAKALADFGSGKVPPKTPNKEALTDAATGEITGGSIAEIWASARAAAEKNGAV